MLRRVLLIPTLALLASCDAGSPVGAIPNPLTPPPPGRTVLVLFDLSASTTSGDARADYRTYFEKVMQGIGEGDRLMVARIVERPLADSIVDGSIDLPRMDMVGKNQRKHNKEKQALVDEMVTKVDALLAEKAALTPIVDTLALSGRYLASGPAGGQKVIVLLSDMVEESKGINFAKAAPDDAASLRLIDELKAKGRLPDLTGVKVFVAGARGMDRERVDRVRKFWAAYFAATGASLDPQDYGPELLDFRP